MDDIAVPIASTSTSGCDDSVIDFQYPWALKVCQRQIEDESMILNVSRPFSTSFNHVQFTWAIRLTDEYVPNSGLDSNRHVLLHLYYKEGPCAEVAVEEVRAQIVDPSTNEALFSGLVLGQNEFSRGSGWPIHVDRERRAEFTNVVHQRVDTNLMVVVEIKMKQSLFEPMNYLPDVESAFRSQRIETACNKFVDDVIEGKIRIPDLEHVDEKQTDKFSIHRLIFIYGVDAILGEISANDQSESCEKLVRNSFAHIYFARVLSREVHFFDDFIDLLDGVTYAHLPALRKEVERFICQQLLSEQLDATLAKKLLLIAEKYNLDVLKMVVNGLLVDQIIGNSNPPKEFLNITHDLERVALEIHDQENAENLVGTVVTDLQELTRRVRRVSLSHSPSQSSHSSSSSPLATPTNGGQSPAVPTPFDSPTSRFKRVSLA